MYCDFYGLTEKPFNLTASPRFLYLGEVHKEALAFLSYGIVERKSFVVLTGDVGTGKTMVLKALLANLDENARYVYLSNPPRSVEGLMDYLILSVFKRNMRFKSEAAFLIAFEKVLDQYLHEHKTFSLIIDEAHRLSFELLEEIRLLSNMETYDEKLINIFLVGQPELNEKLRRARSRGLMQRISIWSHITPLDLDGTTGYIQTRLKVAGNKNGKKLFPDRTIKALHEFSYGYPRKINVLADNALLLGYTRETKIITPAMIEECYQNRELEHAFPAKAKQTLKRPRTEKIIPLNPTSYLKLTALVIGILFFVFVMAKTAWQFFEHTPSSMRTLNEVVSQEAIEHNASPLVEGVNKVTQNIKGPIYKGIIDSQTVKQKTSKQ